MLAVTETRGSKEVGDTRTYHHGLRNISLDVQDGSQLEQHADERRVGRRRCMLQERHVAHCGLRALNTETVFHTDGQAMKRAQGLSLSAQIFI